MLQKEIGDAAGKLWRFLEKNGPASLSKIKKNLDLPPSLIERSIGWLARENKLRDVKKGNTIVFEAVP